MVLQLDWWARPAMSSESVRRPWLLLAVGLVLVVNPLALPIADLASPDHVYERASISASGEQLQWDGGLHEPIDGIDCFEDPGHACGVEGALVGETVTVSDPNRAGLSGDATPDRFVALEDGWYRRVDEEAGGEYRLSLEAVSLETVLQEVSRRPTDVPERLRPAARGGEAVLEWPVETTYVVRDGGRYYHLTRTEIRRPPLAGIYVSVSRLAVLLGAVVLVHAGREMAATEAVG